VSIPVITRKYLVAHLALVAIAGATWWAAEAWFSDEPSERRETAGAVDYYSKGVKRTAYDADGKAANLLLAANMEHFKGDDHTELDRPIMTLYQDNGEPPWIIRSDTGTLQSGGDLLLLNGTVFITKDNDKGEQLKITTRNVRYQPAKEYAETAEAVRMETPTDLLTGVGMEAQLKPNLILKVLSEVRRTHEAHH
jgi:lipopolysaccharide export system protein LptC